MPSFEEVLTQLLILRIPLIFTLAFCRTYTQRVIGFLACTFLVFYTWVVLFVSPEFNVKPGWVRYSTVTGLSWVVLVALDFLVFEVEPSVHLRCVPSGTPAYHYETAKPKRPNGQGSPESSNGNLNTARNTNGHATSPPPVASLSAFERLKWATSLAHNSRCIRTVAQVRNINLVPHELVASRRAFCLDRLKCLVCNTVVLAGLMGAVWYWDMLPALIACRALLDRALVTASGFAVLYLGSSIGHQILSILGVSLALTYPDDWPDLFGSLHHGYTLARFWGYVWHQQYYRVFSAAGSWVTDDVLHMARRSMASKIVKYFVAFGLSALAHSTGDITLFRGSRFPSLVYILKQPFGILLEGGVINAARIIAPKGFWDANEGYTRMIGYAWVFAWFCFCQSPPIV